MEARSWRISVAPRGSTPSRLAPAATRSVTASARLAAPTGAGRQSWAPLSQPRLVSRSGRGR